MRLALAWTTLTLTIATLTLAAACGDDESADTGGLEGEACAATNICAKGLFCFIEQDGQDGVCRTLPEGCGADPNCVDGCMDAVQSECLNSSLCLAVGTAVTITCGAPPPAGGAAGM